MRTVLLVCLLAVGCGKAAPTSSPDGAPKGDATPAGDPHAELRKNPQDHRKYVARLKDDVPITMDRFKANQYEAESYTPHADPSMFKEVVVKLSPVALRDDITGRTEVYTRARLTLNDPKPGKLNPKTGFPTSIPEPYGWASVEMLP
jgi:hypothetical protein